MNYLELKKMRKKYCGNALKVSIAISSFYLITIYFLALEVLLVGALNLILIKLFLVVTFNVVIVPLVSICLCTLRIFFYLTDEMKKAKMEETVMRN